MREMNGGNNRVYSGQPKTNEQPSSTDERDTSKPVKEHSVPTPSRGINKLQSPPPAGNKSKTNKKHRYTRDKGMFWISVATLVVVGFYAWYARQQAIETEKAANAAEESADAAKAAIKVAEDTLKANIDMAHREQRAWVGPVQVLPATLRDATNKPVFLIEGPSPTFEVVIINSGKSPALKVKAVTNAYLLSSNVKLLPGYSKAMISVGVLQPQMRYKLVTKIPPLTTPIIDSIKDGNKILYIFGKITYEDIFRIPHRTTFCMYLIPSLDNFSACDTYNDAD